MIRTVSLVAAVLGLIHSYTIVAMDTSGLKSSNYSSVTCPGVRQVYLSLLLRSQGGAGPNRPGPDGLYQASRMTPSLGRRCNTALSTGPLRSR